jgi:hypothetical protein
METQEKEPINYLAKFQSELKVPKGQYNSFGKYKYRSAEDIVEAVKPIINADGFSLTLTDEIVMIGDRYYVKATVTLFNIENTYSAIAFAREEETKKGMDGSQITGSASSYARKYALNGLFAIDDVKDADANEHNQAPEKKAEPKPFLTTDSSTWEQAVEYAKVNGIDPILAKYAMSEDDLKIMKREIKGIITTKTKTNETQL